MAPPHNNNRNAYSHAPSLDSAQAVAQLNASRPRAAANTSPVTNVAEGYGRQRVTSNTPAYGPCEFIQPYLVTIKRLTTPDGSSSREPSLMRGFGGGSTQRARPPSPNHRMSASLTTPTCHSRLTCVDYPPNALNYHGPRPSNSPAVGDYGGFPQQLPAAPRYRQPSSAHAFGSHGGSPPSLPAAPMYCEFELNFVCRCM